MEQRDLGERPQAYVSQYSGASWASLGAGLNLSPAGSAQRATVAALGGAPVVVWGEVNYGATRQLYARKWNGSNWTALGATATAASGTGISGSVIFTGKTFVQ